MPLRVNDQICSTSTMDAKSGPKSGRQEAAALVGFGFACR
jgi:hypothetical protein